MKTQDELRDIADDNVESWCIPEGVREVLADYLRLTDPTPLTAEHCRAAGMGEAIGDVAFSNGTTLKDTTVFADFREPESLLDAWNPTVGMLNLALAQEESR